jgi:hypothetical protein
MIIASEVKTSRSITEDYRSYLEAILLCLEGNDINKPRLKLASQQYAQHQIYTFESLLHEAEKMVKSMLEADSLKCWKLFMKMCDIAKASDIKAKVLQKAEALGLDLVQLAA